MNGNGGESEVTRDEPSVMEGDQQASALGKEWKMKKITYQQAKKKARLWDEEVEMAKALGISPEALIHNIPSKKEPWKDSVALWVRRKYDREILRKS